MRCLPMLMAVTLAQVSAPPTVPEPHLTAYRALVTTFSDAHTIVQILKPSGGFLSTPNFPHQPVPKPHEGLTLTALQVEYVVEKEGVAATVSLRYGIPNQRVVQIASVRLRDDQAVEVPRLADFGVDPITLTLRDALPAVLVQATVATVSSAIDVRIALPAPEIPLYNITLTNRSARSVLALDYKMYRGDKVVVSARRRANRGLPAVEADAQQEFTVQAANGTDQQGFDRFEVTGVLWADWSVEGDATLKASEKAFAMGQAQQLRDVITLLQDPSVASLADLCQRLVAVPVAGPVTMVMMGQRHVIEAVLSDLKSLPPSPSWRQDAIARYGDWLTRIAVR